MENHFIGKRDFLKKSAFAAASGLVGVKLFTACKPRAENEQGVKEEEHKEREEKEEEVSPAEDLMREHGVLNRILLIYDRCQSNLMSKKDFPIEALLDSASIMKDFIEGYHEKLEEDYLFPRFQKANKFTDLVQILTNQHHAGRAVTELIIQKSKAKTVSQDDRKKLTHLLGQFITMYRPHEAREDTVLFPALKTIVSRNEYDSMGEDFEEKEHQLFGEDGFDVMVERVAKIEKQLGIYDLSQFTPKASG